VHLHLPHLPVPAVLLSVVYVAAVAVALTHPGAPTLAGLVVLAGLVARWALRGRFTAATPVPLAVADGADAVRPAEPAVAPAAAA
jgi:predicted NBD/HSP70 family sugar kinase